MVSPRSELIDLEATPYYHCINRCVRGSFLCGDMPELNKNYDHRKKWIVSRIKFLSQIFAIKICSYAVMSNHYHLILFVDTNKANQWTTDDVKNRWATLFPQNSENFNQQCASLSAEIIEQKITQWRERLYDISWFMRCLNELIANLSNKEEESKGKFWNGRFKSQALLDDAALLTAMAYVDLNPIRAKISKTPEQSDFTSIQERLTHLQKHTNTQLNANSIHNAKQPKNLMPFDSNNLNDNINFDLYDYIQLVEETGRTIREDKPGFIPGNIAPLLLRLNLAPSGWISMTQLLQSHFSRAIGAADKLIKFTKDNLKQAPKGIKIAKACYQ